jgi:hypothetical protein
MTFAIAVAAVLPSCTTFVRPTVCEPRATTCGGIHDARFCHYVATAVEGTDCTALGIVERQPFCVVTSEACTDTTYEVKARDCKVVNYRLEKDSYRADCAPGTPIFINR